MRGLVSHNQSGGVLLEILVALVLLSGGMVAGLEMTRAAQLGLDSSWKRVRAMTLAQSLIEEKRALPYVQMIGGPSQGRESFGDIIRQWEVTADSGGSYGATVWVNCSWTGRSGQSNSVVLRLFRSGEQVP